MLLASLAWGWWLVISLALMFLVLSFSDLRRGRWRKVVGSIIGSLLFVAFLLGGFLSNDHGVLVYYLVPYMAVGYVYTLLTSGFYDFHNLGRHKWRKLPWRLLELTFFSALWFADLEDKIRAKIEPGYRRGRRIATRRSDA